MQPYSVIEKRIMRGRVIASNREIINDPHEQSETENGNRWKIGLPTFQKFHKKYPGEQPGSSSITIHLNEMENVGPTLVVAQTYRTYRFETKNICPGNKTMVLRPFRVNRGPAFVNHPKRWRANRIRNLNILANVCYNEKDNSD